MAKRVPKSFRAYKVPVREPNDSNYNYGFEESRLTPAQRKVRQ